MYKLVHIELVVCQIDLKMLVVCQIGLNFKVNLTHNKLNVYKLIHFLLL